MRKELFGVYGDRETFDRFRSADEFTEMVEGEAATIGVRDPGLGTPVWSARYTGEEGVCVVWGEVYTPAPVERNAAKWLLDRYHERRLSALSELNGSYLAVISTGDRMIVATDPIRSWECFYTDDPGVRVFGTDAAAVAGAIRSPSIRTEAMLEYLHMGVTLGEKTSFEQLHRLPMDSYLTRTGHEPLDRFVYEQAEFDYAAELAERLERAIDRRAQLPGRKGLLLSAGYDSRTLLAGIPSIEQCYTVGSTTDQEVRGAARLASQYGTGHTNFEPDRRYLAAGEDKVQYSQGIKESLHIHHAGYVDEMDVDTMYHGLLCDTFFRGHFTERDEIRFLGHHLPLERPAPDPDPVESLLGKFGYDSAASERLSAATSLDVDSAEFVREAVSTEFEKFWDRADSIQNALNACGIGNQPSMPFHFQLADNYFGSFLATDRELIDWHLRTPPEHRTTGTFLHACERLDSDLIRHRPPDRPHHAPFLNEIERFVRRTVPFLTPFDPPWPDRNAMFTVYELDRQLLPDLAHLHEPLPARHKLRINDVLGWMEQCSPASADSAEKLFHPSA